VVRDRENSRTNNLFATLNHRYFFFFSLFHTFPEPISYSPIQVEINVCGLGFVEQLCFLIDERELPIHSFWGVSPVVENSGHGGHSRLKTKKKRRIEDGTTSGIAESQIGWDALEQGTAQTRKNKGNERQIGRGEKEMLYSIARKIEQRKYEDGIRGIGKGSPAFLESQSQCSDQPELLFFYLKSSVFLSFAKAVFRVIIVRSSPPPTYVLSILFSILVYRD